MRHALKAACAALAFAAAMGGAEASAQRGWFARLAAQAHENSVRVDQSGDNNGAGVSQTGVGNGASVAQHGADNTSVLRQNGDDNYARMVQLGQGNTMTATQNNSDNALCYIQRGANLSGDVVQNGGDGVIIVQNAQRTRVVTNRVPRWCMENPPQGNRSRAALRGR